MKQETKDRLFFWGMAAIYFLVNLTWLWRDA